MAQFDWIKMFSSTTTLGLIGVVAGVIGAVGAAFSANWLACAWAIGSTCWAGTFCVVKYKQVCWKAGS